MFDTGRASRRAVVGALMAAGAMAPWQWAAAQAFPSKPIHIIVPFPPGGPVDALTRAIGQTLGQTLGQPVIVENKAGANSIIAADYVAKSPADGYTILMATDATISINPILYAKLPYKPQVDFVPLTVVAHVPEYLFVSNEVAANTLPEFIALAKANPGKLTYGSFGSGSSAHLESEAFKAATGTDMLHVPFKGAAEVIPAMLAGRIDMVISSVVQPLPHVRAGKLKALAVMGPSRTNVLPNVPTFREAGLPGFDANPWFGLLAPANTPPAVLDKLISEITKIVGTTEFRDKYIDAVGLAQAPLGQIYFSEVLKADRDKYARYIKTANVKLEE